MKKFFNLSLAIIMAFCCLLTGCSFESTEEPSLDKFVAPASVMTSWGQTTIVDNGTEKYIEKEISASVYPARASQLVDYTVSWTEGATLKSDDVSDYVVVFPESDGSVNAKVRCYKAFGDDIITITVKSRVNDVTSFCSVKYVGLATNIEIVDSTNFNNDISSFLRKTDERGEYYSILQGTDFWFDIKLSNLFGVKQYDLECDISYVGSLWFCIGSTFEKHSLSDFSNYLNDKFSFGAPDALDYQYYLASSFYIGEFKEEGDSIYFPGLGNPVLDDETSYVQKNDLLIESCCYIFTVTEKLSGISTSFKFWIEPVPKTIVLNSSLAF